MIGATTTRSDASRINSLRSRIHRLTPSAFYAVAALLLVFGIRTYLVLTYSSSIPFWDQWDAEIDRLYLPFLQGKLALPDLFSAHNEHRIFFTRLIALAIFELNQHQFDARVQCLANVGIFCASLAIFLRAVLPYVPVRALPLFLLAVVAIFGSPIGWENLIAGFQNQFFLLMGFSVTAIQLAARRMPTYGLTGLLLVISACATLTMASGLLVAIVVMGIILWRWLEGNANLRASAAILLSQLAVAVTAYALMPKHGYLDAFHAKSLGEFLRAAKLILAWPTPPSWGAVLVLWLPAIGLLINVLNNLRLKRESVPAQRVFLGILVWVGIQAMALAYSRGHDLDGVSSRYTDIFVLGVLVNLAVGLRAASTANGSQRVALCAFATGYVALLSTSGARVYIQSYSEMIDRYTRSEMESSQMHNYLATRRIDVFDRLPIPYPDAIRIAQSLQNPLVANLMPPDIRLPVRLSWAECHGFAYEGVARDVAHIKSGNIVGSYLRGQGSASTGVCRSKPFYSAMPYLLLFASGYANPGGAAIAIVDAQGHKRSIQPPSGETWVGTQMRAREQPLSLELTDSSPEHWVAVTEPVEAGRLSALTNSIVVHSWRLLLDAFALAATILTLSLAWRDRHGE